MYRKKHTDIQTLSHSDLSDLSKDKCPSYLKPLLSKQTEGPLPVPTVVRYIKKGWGGGGGGGGGKEILKGKKVTERF